MILAVDPGNTHSAFVLLNDDMSIVEANKLENKEFVDVYTDYLTPDLEYSNNSMHIAIEMIACYGMAVGKSVFDTCVFIGELKAIAEWRGFKVEFIYRKDEKMVLCNSMKAKDANIRQALIDRYAKFDFKNVNGNRVSAEYKE